MTRRRVVITGLGLISPVGNTVAEGWANIVAGRSGIDNVTRFDASGLSCRFAGEVKGFNVEDYIPGKEARHMDTFIHYGIAAAAQAIQDAGLPSGDSLSEEEACRTGVVIGSGIGGSTLASVLARQGLKVIVFEGINDIRHDGGTSADQEWCAGGKSGDGDQDFCDQLNWHAAHGCLSHGYFGVVQQHLQRNDGYCGRYQRREGRYF